MPEYLARHYWWAYLWRPAIWFFDHQPIINLILFGRYQRLLERTLRCLENRPAGKILQLTCVYGKLTSSILKQLDDQDLYLADVATAQLDASRRKLPPELNSRLLTYRMNAEHLAFNNDSFATVLIFFLMHEMPQTARRRTLNETLRILKPGGRLVITEYGEEPIHHWIYRFKLLRQQITYWEPFLQGFWREDLTGLLKQLAEEQGRGIRLVETHSVFNKFYRLLVYEVGSS